MQPGRDPPPPTTTTSTAAGKHLHVAGPLGASWSPNHLDLPKAKDPVHDPCESPTQQMGLTLYLGISAQ